MTDITKLVNRGVPPQERSQYFTQADASGGDVILVEASMGRAAGNVLVEADDIMTFRFNVYHDVFPLRDGRDLMTTAHLPNLALGGRIKDSTTALISLVSGEAFETSPGFPTSDIEIITASGNFIITTT